MYYGDKPQFYGVKTAASNIGEARDSYTAEMFKEDFPQFFNSAGDSLAPGTIMKMFIDRASSAIQADKWLDGWRYACGLYVAHNITMYLKTYQPASETAEQAAGTGALVGVVKSATLGDASVSYDTSALTEATKEWGSLNATIYGQQFATEARLAGLGGSYVL